MSQSFEEISAQLKKRHRRSARMKWLTMGALILSAAFLVVFISDMVVRGWPAFQQAQIQVDVTYNEQSKEIPLAAVSEEFRPLVSRGFFRILPLRMEDNPALMGTTKTQWVIADSPVDQYLKGNKNELSSSQRNVVDKLVKQGRAELKFNTTFFTTGDSKMPELAGIAAAAIGTMMTMLVTMAVCFPIGVMTAVYLEEFAPDNKLTQIIEININNLAAVPSILFGLLGLAIYISFFGVPRSSPLVGGLTLALMTLPVIIISTRAALRSVPDSIRHAAFGVGCSRWQVVRDHVLPVSLPGILTGSIIGLAQAMGETAPLIIVGMVAFIPEASMTLTDASTVMPAQIFTWASQPEAAFAEKTAGGILVLLAVLIFLNALAVWLRNKFERRW
ncbi:phosphate ABC transporter membrane protein 2 (PhoT family) [Chromohalobacter marismortui]|uniref:Phosphate transport system permease protein PstA n=1 Tax=Chromohalobacter marismortui TaxID=42055 RepID=A0A4R7NV94_9GAMM|nr:MULTISPECIES: phosphate ABC transporter permease PstA [Chromohalobacter]MCI0510506.1 phosphate ABC transporter permease PstA [Chromohalobacter sp.]MCI0594141.1 phosphate ABC transporter permease PstA [Chromohalobacter sp.]TDU24918.1 phosphate ABC transporter membrane protein 2 (PhoT family) [Chromohalobacter marismortui]